MARCTVCNHHQSATKHNNHRHNYNTNLHTGRMSQTSSKRLRLFSRALFPPPLPPPQGAGFAECEIRARHRTRARTNHGRHLVLEQLRKVVREGREVRAAAPTIRRALRVPPRSTVFFSIDSKQFFPRLRGRLAGSDPPRVVFLPVWQWLIRERAGARSGAAIFEAALARVRETGTNPRPGLESAIRKLFSCTADCELKIANARAPAGRQAAELARIGPPNVIDDMLPIGSSCKAR